MGTVNKDVLVAVVAGHTGQTKDVVKSVVEGPLSQITARANAGDTVRFAGFGAFQVKARAARKGRNPATGEEMEIAETTRITFKAAKTA